MRTCPSCGSNTIIEKEKYQLSDLSLLWQGLANTENCLTESGDYFFLYHCKTCLLDSFSASLAGGDAFYSSLAKHEWYYHHEGKTEYEYVQQFMKDGIRVLDVGCGASVLRDKTNKSIDYYGLELNTEAVRQAQQKGYAVQQQFIQDHAKDKKSFYDLVCVFQVLEHLDDIQNFMISVKEVLKPNGKVVIAVPNNEGFLSYQANNAFNLPPHHLNLWTEESLCNMANNLGFNVQEVFYEPLAEIHKTAAYEAYIAKQLYKVCFKKFKLLDLTPFRKKVNKMANYLLHNSIFSKAIWFYLKRRLKHGQSVILTLTLKK